MKFKSKNEAYSCAIILLMKIRAKVAGSKSANRVSDLETIEKGINKIKIAMENHEQKSEIIIGYLTEVLEHSKFSTEYKKSIYSLQEDIRSSDYKQNVKEKHRNPLARRFESEIGISLLQNPTQAMMESVKRVSDEILKLIDDLNFNRYRHCFTEDSHVIAFGSFKVTPTLDEIKKILQENDPAKFAEIMFIHFKFARDITREVPIRHAPVREPVGKLADVIKNIWNGDAKKFFSEGLAQAWNGDYYRSYISDILMYRSSLYTAIPDRGRAGSFDYTRTHPMGLMLNDQAEYEIGFPKHDSAWAADAKSQPANYTSPHVLDLVENDTVYVAGPSGMTSTLLGQMEILANFENLDLKKNYLTAVMTYIVGGGFHSIHEVIGPAQNALELVPGYNVQVPQLNQLAPPPNYHKFFAQQEAIDPEFSVRREQAWENYLNYFNETYAPKYIDGFQSEPLIFSLNQIQINEEPQITSELQLAILKEINSYIKDGPFARGNSYEDKNQLSFISRVFYDVELTKAKLEIAINLKQQLMQNNSLENLKEYVAEAFEKNKNAEQSAVKLCGIVTTGALERSINTINNMIDSYEQEIVLNQQVS